MNWTVRSEPSGNPLTDLHESSFHTVAHLYDGQDPHFQETYARRAEEIVPKFSAAHRDQLVDTLSDHMRQLGANEASMRQLERLRDERAVAVVTGQQAGLFTGPMFSIYKAISTIELAARLERELQRPVVPVFWVASEDHDWAEVNHAYILDQHSDVKRLDLVVHAPLHQMVYNMQIEPTAVDKVVREAYELLPDGPYKEEVFEFIRSAWNPGTSMPVWFARILLKLLEPKGIVMVDPCLPKLRGLVGTVWTQALQTCDEVNRSLDEAYRQVEDAGFTPAVVRDEKNTTLFYVQNGKRYVLERTGTGTLRARGLGLEKPISDWIDIARKDPTQFSSNVLLRPVVQDHLLPTLAYVGGPAEVAYHALSRGVFHAFSRTLPPLLLRQRLTIYPAGVTRAMKKWGISLESVAKPVDLVSPVLAQLGAGEIESAFSVYRAQSMLRWTEWKRTFGHLGPQVAAMAEAQVSREEKGLKRLEHKTLQLFRQQHMAHVRQIQQIQSWLWTDGTAQERRLCPLPVWVRYGFDWLHEMEGLGDYQAVLPVFHVEL